MTTVLARRPLEPLSMSSTQRLTRRRSARQAFEDEELDHGAGKKTKVDGGNTASSASATNGVDKGRRKTRKLVYEDLDDGFQFSKTKTRKSKTQAADIPEPIPEESVKASSTAPAPSRRRKKDPSPAPQSQDDEDAATAIPRRRRSARLSGEKEQLEPQSAALPAPKPRRSAHRKTLNAFSEVDEEVALVTVKKPRRTSKVPETKSRAQPEERERSPEPPAAPAAPVELTVTKTRSPTKITLPFADTPIIKRNKEMRKGGQGSRRSSTGTRGRRASSLIESGTSNAVPHSEVRTEDFYKHISQEIPEPRRMKQLLVWCGSRAMLEKPHGGVKDTSAILAARAIQEELLEDFAQKSELSDWFSRETSTSAAVSRKPNPRNERMAEMVKELQEEIRRLEIEEAAWKAVTAASKTLPQPSPPASKLDTENNPPVASNISPDLLDDPIQSSILAALIRPPETSSSGDDAEQETSADSSLVPKLPANTSPTAILSRVNAVLNSVEPSIDIFADGVHQLSQYQAVAERVADRVLGAAAEQLEERDGAMREQAGMTNVGLGDVLGTLGKVMSERQQMGR